MANKAQLLEQAQELNIEVPEGATNAEIKELIANADDGSEGESPEQEEDLRAGLPEDAGQEYPTDPDDEVDETADDTKEDQQQVVATNTGAEEFIPNIAGYSYGSAPDTDQSPAHLKKARENDKEEED